ncbi:MAG: M56 family metallopeptidase, partial [Microcystaceae cyanobacterium]
MHLLMILLAFSLAWNIRLTSPQSIGNWTERWRRSLFLFLFPPLLLLTTAIAVLCMGYEGSMLGLQASWSSYMLAVIFISCASIALLQITYQVCLTLRRIRSYPQQLIAGKSAKILDISFPYSAQIGFWEPKLVISQGLLNSLDPRHLQAVLAHEQAHYHYRDTFWFFWLGWLQYFTVWLPNTEALWQELLLLREMRADRQASQEVDALLLAESLLIITQSVSQSTPFNVGKSFCVGISCTVPR